MAARCSFSPFESLRTALLTALAAVVLAACGAGGDGDGAGGAGGVGGTGLTSNVVSTGVMTKGSTIVNGVRFEDNTANISIDDTPKTALQLQNGMVVKLVGNVNADGVTGSAQRIKALVEVRGIVSPPLAGPQSLVVNGQTVFVDDQTVFSNLTGLGVIQTPTLIEVHGLRGADGNIRATRIEANTLQMADSSLDEIRGVVTGGSGANPRTFSLGGQPINALNAVILPTGASWQNGSVVEVYCSARPSCIVSGVFQASRLKVEDAQDVAFKPTPGQRVEAEGLISGFTVHPGTFSVGTTPVTTTSSTRFEGGIADDLADNVKVEAEGSWDGTRLVASKIEFKRSVIRLQGNVITSSLTQLTLNVAGRSVTVEIDSLTSLPGGVVPPASTTTCVQVRGQRKTPATPVVVTAGEIDTSCSGGGGSGGGGGGSGFRPLIQAPVEAENGATLTLLGFPINVAGATDGFQDVNDVPISLDAFLNAVTPATTNAAGVSVAGTLVKVSFNGGTNTVREADLED